MREMKNSHIPFCESIPSNWNEMPNKYLFSEHSVKVGNEHSKYQLLSLTKNGVKEKDINASGGKVPDSYENYQTVTPGDMIFCLFDLDCSAVFSGLSGYNGMITSAYNVLKPNEKYIDAHFVDYWFQYVFSNRYYKMFSKNIRYTVTSEMFGSIYTPVPDITTQKKIGVILDEKSTQIDTLIANQEAQIEKLKQYKQSLITEVVTKGLNPDAEMKDSGIDILGKIPKQWKVSRVKNIGHTQNGISKGGEFFGSGYPFVSYGDVYKHFELPSKVVGLVESTIEEQKSYSVEEGDIFFTRTSETIEEVGFSSVCTNTIENATFAGFLIRLRPFNDDLITGYAKYYFRGDHIRKFITKEMNIVTRASLGQSLLKSMFVLVPPKDEQEQISKYLDKTCGQIDMLINIKQKKITKLNEFKKSLIYEYVTGKKEVV